jgi:hypothetical protein
MLRDFGDISVAKILVQKPQVSCEHCKMLGHIKAQCYRLHGKPQNVKTNAINTIEVGNRVNLAESAEDPIDLSAFAAGNVERQNSLACILDSGCSDHMFPSSEGMTHLRPFAKSISIADGQRI